MLTIYQIKQILSKVSYKPGWVFEVSEPDDVQGLRLSIHVTMEDSYKPGNSTELHIHSPIQPLDNQDAFLRWLLWRLKLVEMHELLEWFKVDSKPWIDPHKSPD